MTILVLVLLIGLSAANGSNDVPKAVATLAGAGVTKFRTAILWGTATTLVGCLVSLQLAGKMTELFSTGIVSARPSPAFTAAVLLGTASWVVLATILRLPVSTTHALIGALLGAGVLYAAGSVRWGALVPKVVLPLLLSVLVAYALSLGLALISRVANSLPRPGQRAPGPGAATADEITAIGRQSGTSPSTMDRVLGVAHWATSGFACVARGLNDTPKIVAIGAFALVPIGWQSWQILLVVTAAMAIGSLAGGLRVAKRLANDVVTMSHREGFTANLTTAVLVGLGAGAGLPMSTTHVSTGAIAGCAGKDLSRINGKTIRGFAVAWVVTPPFAGLVAAGAYALLG